MSNTVTVKGKDEIYVIAEPTSSLGKKSVTVTAKSVTVKVESTSSASAIEIVSL